jgi:alpha-galactosidase
LKSAALLCAAVTSAAALDVNVVRRAPSSVDPQQNGLSLVRVWTGNLCRSKLVNRGDRPMQVREVVLFAIPHELPPETAFYGEGSQMLSQTAGTLARPSDLGRYTDRRHYRIPQPSDATTAYGVITLSPPAGGHILLAFASSRRFVGRFYIRERRIDVVVDTENLTIAPGESWDLEEFLFASGPRRPDLLATLAARIVTNHPPLRWRRPPTGWCSWYCFGPRVTARNVLDNLGAIASSLPALRYIQIDDGYQAAMGDWLDTGGAFGGDVRGVLQGIREQGFEPAIWVAPFVAEGGSKLFREHPEWFVKDADGSPLRSDKVTFGGWRRGPWYALDGTHPGAQRYLESVFRTMRNKWGVTYFKLDANFWGAIHGGRFYDPKATRVEAYRRGIRPSSRARGTRSSSAAIIRFGPRSA